MATGTASGGSRLPRGSAVFTTFPDLLFVFEFVSGGLVWILILLAQVPVPLVQGWVLFVSVSCFIVTTLLLCLYIVGAHKNWSFWITLDTAYHCLAALFYFSASALETLVTIGLQDDIYKHYSENISAVQPEDAGAVITPMSQMGSQAPRACTTPPGVTRSWRSLGSKCEQSLAAWGPGCP
ncbi:myelin and lymphocyte protein-like isoform X1 [Cervus elaphus]|uniref:myelin and lymphocyte protein-like isoform X1 n=1 Tax=Cervus elaphus TaxID=9860 RepID=UPI001CC2B25A|nr:myelin and lymphocyte protein-like isoform X1 [Cervus elaphus]